jgi:5'-3' exonuclease
MVVLACDFMNLCYRARAGFTADNSVVYNFFRGFKALIDQFKPNRVYVAMEGHPKHRHSALPEYKAMRPTPPDGFMAQVGEISRLISTRFPVSVVRHCDFECDDTIANLAMRSSTAVDWIVASSDSDFTQLLVRPNIKLYNPVSKKFVERTPYDYVVWKALRGDPTDNIPGIPKCGDKTAAKLALGPDKNLREYLAEGNRAEIFVRNLELVAFSMWDDDTAAQMTCSTPEVDWDVVRADFDARGFKSITNDKSWAKFVSTFEALDR